MKQMLFLILLALTAACSPMLPSLPTAPAMNPTAIAIAAEATVTAMAAANQATQPAPLETAAPDEPAFDPSPTAIVIPQISDFWVTFITNRRLAVLNGNGSQTGLLTNTPSMDYLPTWSPNGQNLGFIRFFGSNLQDGIIHILPAGSTTPVQIDPNHLYNNFTWLPDNHTILATRSRPDSFEVFLIDTISGLPTQIASNTYEYPQLSPDGKKVLLLVNNGEPCNGKGCISPNDIYVYDIESRSTARLTSDEGPKMAASWSPDGQQIAFVLVDVMNNLVNIIQVDGKPVSAQQEAPWWKYGWRTSPDGSLLAYYVNDTVNGAAEIYVRPATGGDARRVIRVEMREDQPTYIDTLRWRPDGSGFVFNAWIDLYTVNLDGSGLRMLPIKLENIFYDVRPTADTFNLQPEPTQPAEWNLCPGGKPTRLDIGRRATVSKNPPVPNNVRIGPDKRSDLVGQIQPGEEVEIIGGPLCENGQVWWEIRSLSSGLKGYTLEGDNKDYWLIPVQ